MPGTWPTVVTLPNKPTTPSESIGAGRVENHGTSVDPPSSSTPKPVSSCWNTGYRTRTFE